MSLVVLYIVTMRRLEDNPDLNPRDKKIGRCPLTGKKCTDQTGNQHNMVISAMNAKHANEKANKIDGWRVSRIEEK